jgi:hypothetical protein
LVWFRGISDEIINFELFLGLAEVKYPVVNLPFELLNNYLLALPADQGDRLTTLGYGLFLF